ncbi:helix-turn-helix transcriptional regulator [Xanthomonas axonopodis pv. cassiae]|uniref:helix-turn-helix transcriptional regulator n=1 Tax=Xanthomonas TaxID=338 RepID=UPI0009B9A6C1
MGSPAAKSAISLEEYSVQHDLITGSQAARIAGISRTQVGRLAASGDFPAAVKFSARIILWNRVEVQAWADWCREQDAPDPVDDE